MPYQGLKPTISQTKDRLRGILRGKQAQPGNASPYATRHSNFSVWTIAKSIKGMVSHRRVDQNTNEPVAEDINPLLQKEHEDKRNDPVPIITFPDDLDPEFKRELEIAASTANAAMLEKLAVTANVRKREGQINFRVYDTIPELLVDYGTRPKWIMTYGADGKLFSLVDPLRMNVPEQTDEDEEEEEDEDEGVAFVDKKGKTAVYKVGKPSKHVTTLKLKRKTRFPSAPITLAPLPSHELLGWNMKPRQVKSDVE
ncbi:hypothetical protein IWX47DRAFT_929069 [Phyllosticta citricarpa]